LQIACETLTSVVSLGPAASLDLDEFGQDFSLLSALYDKLEMARETTFVPELLETGKQVRQGTGTWTKDDLRSIVRWKHMHSLMPKIAREARDIELRLAHAFDVQDEESRMAALGRIPGIGPAIASVLLTLTFPEKYASLDNHAWNGLCRIGFELTRRPFSGGGYSIAELRRYEKILVILARMVNATPSDVAKALHALDQVSLKTKWKREFDSLKSLFSLSVLASPSTDPRV
jgi:hypothetical protein